MGHSAGHFNELTNHLQHLTNSIRVIEIDDQPWFVAADVCRILGLTNPTLTLRKLDAEEQTLIRNKGQTQRAAPCWKAVSESGLYKLIMRSDKPEAKEFQNWVTKVVLPAIRKDGGYQPDKRGFSTLLNPKGSL